MGQLLIFEFGNEFQTSTFQILFDPSIDFTVNFRAKVVFPVTRLTLIEIQYSAYVTNTSPWFAYLPLRTNVFVGSSLPTPALISLA